MRSRRLDDSCKNAFKVPPPHAILTRRITGGRIGITLLDHRSQMCSDAFHPPVVRRVASPICPSLRQEGLAETPSRATPVAARRHAIRVGREPVALRGAACPNQ